MATKKYSVKGKALWSKVFDSNKELKDWQGNPHDFGGLFKIDVILDKENKAIYKSSGTSGKGKFGDDGNFIATFKRKETTMSGGKVLEWASGAPQVVNADGSAFTGTLIPNGSDVEVEFTVYTTSMSPGTRLEKVIVHSMAEMPVREEPKDEAPEVKKETKVNVEIPF
jgi:hypothetical protein